MRLASLGIIKSIDRNGRLSLSLGKGLLLAGGLLTTLPEDQRRSRRDPDDQMGQLGIIA
jgi:hypothetical protein